MEEQNKINNIKKRVGAIERKKHGDMIRQLKLEVLDVEELNSPL